MVMQLAASRALTGRAMTVVVKGEARDVVIVGGGPAGSTCARALTRAGVDVVILDKAVFPRDKTCAGWITPAVVDAVDLPIDEYREGRVFQPISAFRTSRIGSARPLPIRTSTRDSSAR